MNEQPFLVKVYVLLYIPVILFHKKCGERIPVAMSTHFYIKFSLQPTLIFGLITANTHTSTQSSISSSDYTHVFYLSLYKSIMLLALICIASTSRGNANEYQQQMLLYTYQGNLNDYPQHMLL